MYTDLDTLCVNPDDTIHQAIARMDSNGKGIVLVVDLDRHLLGTITDGDVRRAMLASLNLYEPVQLLLDRKASLPSARPITAPVGTDSSKQLNIIRAHKIRHLPLVDQDRIVVALVTLDGFVPQEELPVQPVIMAGGLGLRLRPLTEELPKPMLPVGGRPLLESILEQLHAAGVNRINLITHYKKEVISNHFGDGSGFGVEIQYVEEDQPLGTAGGLGLLEVSDKPLLVINGDIFTKVDFRAMVDFHRDNKADMSVAVKEKEFRLPYGMVETDGLRITSISEKPVIRHFINAGIYLLDPELCSHIPVGKPYDMTDLISLLIMGGRNVVSFPVHEYWQDIGQVEDYQRAQEDSNRDNS